MTAGRHREHRGRGAPGNKRNLGALVVTLDPRRTKQSERSQAVLEHACGQGRAFVGQPDRDVSDACTIE
jgi:hypothetical protein